MTVEINKTGGDYSEITFTHEGQKLTATLEKSEVREVIEKLDDSIY